MVPVLLVELHPILKVELVVLAEMVNNTVSLVHRFIMLAAALVDTKTIHNHKLARLVDKVVVDEVVLGQMDNTHRVELQTVAAEAVAVVLHLQTKFQCHNRNILKVCHLHLLLVVQ